MKPRIRYPDGYYPDGAPRPWQHATVLERQRSNTGYILLVENSISGERLSVPEYAVEYITDGNMLY